MTILEVVRQAVRECGSLAPGEVVTQMILTGYNHTPVADVWRALETIQTGRQHQSNKNKAQKTLKLTPEANPTEELKQIGVRQRKRYWDRKALGICQSCDSKAVPGRILCQKHIDAESRRNVRNYARKKYTGLEGA